MTKYVCGFIFIAAIVSGMYKVITDYNKTMEIITVNHTRDQCTGQYIHITYTDPNHIINNKQLTDSLDYYCKTGQLDDVAKSRMR